MTFLNFLIGLKQNIQLLIRKLTPMVESTDNWCRICFKASPNDPRACPLCNKPACAQCMHKWLKMNATCPSCTRGLDIRALFSQEAEIDRQAQAQGDSQYDPDAIRDAISESIETEK